MNTSIGAAVGALLVLAGAVATLQPAQRAAGIVAGVAALAAAAVLAWSEARWALEPVSWVFSIAVALTVLAQVLRVERADVSHESSEVR